VRVVAGEARGRKLVAPDGARPTSDRVREATFNALNSLGVVDGAVVLDLYAGSGALGIEALSRGAAHCTFVDTSTTAIRAIEANVATVGFGDRATIVRSDALTFLARREHFDLVLADPPYAFGDWPPLFAAVEKGQRGGATVWLTVESDRAVEPASGWRTVREKRYGGTVVTIVAHDGQPATE
jgi:16S rRNA (guanine966-N2)-methyltransferase